MSSVTMSMIEATPKSNVLKYIQSFVLYIVNKTYIYPEVNTTDTYSMSLLLSHITRMSDLSKQHLLRATTSIKRLIFFFNRS